LPSKYDVLRQTFHLTKTDESLQEARTARELKEMWDGVIPEVQEVYSSKMNPVPEDTRKLCPKGNRLRARNTFAPPTGGIFETMFFLKAQCLASILVG